MKKLFLSLMLVMAGISVFAQCNNNEVEEPMSSSTTVMLTAGGGYMARDGRNLTLDGRELTDAEVRELVGAENYETYLSAKKQITAGRVFTGVFIGTAAATVVCWVTAIAKKDLDLAYTSYIPAIAADVSCPLMFIFNGIGKGRMNWVADEYNKSQRTAMSYSFSPSVMRVQDNTGLGLTFSFNF
jgi:hypothetical protein